MKKYLFYGILLFILLYILPLGFRPLFSPDETRYGEIAREMIVSGDYVSPHLNGVRYFEKPVLGYWLYAGGIKLFGENAFALRLPGMLLTGLCALMLLFFANRYDPDNRTGLLAAGIFLTFPLVFMIANICILDSIFSFFITAVMVSFFMGWTAKSSVWKKSAYWFAAGIFAGLAFLTKGFLAFILPAAVVIPFLIWQKKWKKIFVVPWLPLLSALLVIMPWGILIALAEPDYWRYFLVEEHWNRFFGGAAAQHPEPFFYFIPILLAGLAQWLFLAPAAVMGLKKKGFDSEFVRYLICWFAGPFILLSCSSGKLPTYILPCFVPLAILLAIGIIRWIWVENRVKWMNVPVMILIGLCVLCVIFLFLNQLLPVKLSFCPKIYRGAPTVPGAPPAEGWKWLLCLNGVIFMLLFLFTSLREKDVRQKLIYFVLVLSPVILFYPFCIPRRVIESRCAGVIYEESMKHVPENAVLVAHHNNFQPVCWLYKRMDVWQVSSGENEYGLAQPDAKHRLIPTREFRGFVKKHQEKGIPVAFFISKYRYGTFQKKGFLPEGKYKFISMPENKDSYVTVIY